MSTSCHHFKQVRDGEKPEGQDIGGLVVCKGLQGLYVKARCVKVLYVKEFRVIEFRVKEFRVKEVRGKQMYVKELR